LQDAPTIIFSVISEIHRKVFGCPALGDAAGETANSFKIGEVK
jgi:hypothetical protein